MLESRLDNTIFRLGFAPTRRSARQLVSHKHFLVNNKVELAKYVKANIYGKKIVIGMGAGTISTWMRELPKLI